MTQFVGVTEIAIRLGISRQRAHEHILRDDFPDPLGSISLPRTRQVQTQAGMLRQLLRVTKGPADPLVPGNSLDRVLAYIAEAAEPGARAGQAMEGQE